MSRRDANDTFETIEGRYDKWSEANPKRRGPTALKIPELSDSTEKLVGMAMGFGAGAVLLLLAGLAVAASASWSAIGRSGAGLAYGVSAFFLVLAGVGAIAATYNHIFRIIPGDAPEHH